MELKAIHGLPPLEGTFKRKQWAMETNGQCSVGPLGFQSLDVSSPKVWPSLALTCLPELVLGRDKAVAEIIGFALYADILA